MRLIPLFKIAAQKIADYHLAHRAHIGGVLGLAVGVGLSYTGFGQQLGSDLADLFCAAGAASEEKQAFATMGLQIIAAGVTAIGAIADAVIHSYREKITPLPPS